MFIDHARVLLDRNALSLSNNDRTVTAHGQKTIRSDFTVVRQ